MRPSFSIIFLAGGSGQRMGNVIPKQYLLLRNKPIALYSFEVFASLPEVDQLIVVCEPKYQALFKEIPLVHSISIHFALPGKRRQDSVYHGLQLIEGNPLVCVHDSARPFIDSQIVRKTVEAANVCGAAAVGVKAKSTIKICDRAQRVIETPNRDSLWEVQTPQVVRYSILKEGFDYSLKHSLTVTDDVSLVELLEKQVNIIEGSYSNIKITNPIDLIYAEQLL